MLFHIIQNDHISANVAWHLNTKYFVQLLLSAPLRGWVGDTVVNAHLTVVEDRQWLDVTVTKVCCLAHLQVKVCFSLSSGRKDPWHSMVLFFACPLVHPKSLQGIHVQSSYYCVVQLSSSSCSQVLLFFVQAPDPLYYMYQTHPHTREGLYNQAEVVYGYSVDKWLW